MHIVLNPMETIMDALALPHFVRENDLWNLELTHWNSNKKVP